MDGIVVWYSPDKKMGLIKDKSGKLHFVHQDQIKNKGVEKLEVGKKIKFQLGEFPGFVESVKTA